MQQRLSRYDVVRWAEDFMNELAIVKNEQNDYAGRSYDFYKKELVISYRKTRTRVLFLDYDGTMVPFVKQL